MNVGMIGHVGQFARTDKNVLCFGRGFNAFAFTAGGSRGPFPAAKTFPGPDWRIFATLLLCAASAAKLTHPGTNQAAKTKRNST